MSLLDATLRGALMRLSPESAHRTALRGLASAAALPGGVQMLRHRYAPADEPVSVCGLSFRNRIGLAAGYDKDAEAVIGLDALGFGHLELGTVTPLPQEGNPGVRIVRLAEQEALVNRMGFPSQGMARFAEGLARARKKPLGAIIGVNLGKNRATPNEDAVNDYLLLLEHLAPLADYVTVNVSSPNTKGLRDLGAPAALERLLRPLVERRDAMKPELPIWVKLSPDALALEDAARAVQDAGADAIVVSNTTLSRPIATTAAGGLSGRPLRELALRALGRVAEAVDLPLIAVGGVLDGADVSRRLDAGAVLVQVFTGLVYRGPEMLRRLR